MCNITENANAAYNIISPSLNFFGVLRTQVLVCRAKAVMTCLQDKTQLSSTRKETRAILAFILQLLLLRWSKETTRKILKQYMPSYYTNGNHEKKPVKNVLHPSGQFNKPVWMLQLTRRSTLSLEMQLRAREHVRQCQFVHSNNYLYNHLARILSFLSDAPPKTDYELQLRRARSFAATGRRGSGWSV